MQHCSLSSLLGILTTLAIAIPSPVWALKPAEISAKAKGFTIQIDGVETGSGTIIEQNGNVYTAITSWHVVDSFGNYEITTEDGVKHQVERIKHLENIDLAVVEFSSDNNYSTAQLGESEALVEGSETFVVGYPDPIPGIPERTYRFADANIVSQLSTSDNGYELIHTTPLAPGSSGGGILDDDANLVGVNGATTFDGNTNTAYGLAIPLQLYLDRETDLTEVSLIRKEQPGEETEEVVSDSSISNTAGKPNNSDQDSDDIAANNGTLNSLVNVGKKQIRQIKYEDAVSTFERALADNPDNIDAHYGRGEAYFRLGNFKGVIQDFDRVIELNPQDAQAYLYRAYSNAELEKYDSAIADFDRAVNLDHNNVNAYISRSSVYRDLQDDQNALVDLNEAIEIDPNSFDAYYERGSIYQDIGKSEQAIADYTKAISISPEKKIRVLKVRAMAYLDIEQEPKAIEDLETAADLLFEQGEIEQSRQTFAMLEEFAQDYLEEKLEAYDKAIELKPHDVFAFQKRALLYNKLGRSDKALKDYTQVLKLNPQDAEAYGDRAWLYNSLGNPEQAIADYSKIFSLNSEDFNVYNKRGVAYTTIAEYSNAINDFDRAIELNPNFAMAYINRGLTYRSLGRYQKAIADLQTASELLKKQNRIQEHLEVVNIIQEIENP